MAHPQAPSKPQATEPPTTDEGRQHTRAPSSALVQADDELTQKLATWNPMFGAVPDPGASRTDPNAHKLEMAAPALRVRTHSAAFGGLFGQPQ